MLIGATTASDPSWLVEHSTLIVGTVGILVSGLLGPTITSLWTTKRESDKDKRARVVAQRDDLRAVLDEAAVLLGSAISQLRPVLAAHEKGDDMPAGPSDFLKTLKPMGLRLRLRLPLDHEVVKAYDAAHEALTAMSTATGSTADWDAATELFNTRRTTFLEAGRAAIVAPIDIKKES